MIILTSLFGKKNKINKNKMLKKDIFGLDISDHSIEALMLSKPVFGKARVDSYARTVLRGQVVKDGKIKNEKKLQENLVKLLESANPKPITSPYCIISLPESQVFTAIFKFPAGLKEKEIKNTIPFKAEEIIPFKSSEIYFDFKTIATVGETQEVFYVAVPIKVVESYVAALEGVGLKPVAFDLESNSLARALLARKRAKNAQLLVDIGSRTTNLNIFDKNGIRQSLVIKIAGDRFTKSVAKKLNITLKQAQELKAKNGFDAKKQQGKVLLVLQNEFKRIVEETKSLIEFYQGEAHRQVEEAVMVGGSALLPKVDQYLADNLGIKVTLGDPLQEVADPQGLLKPKTKALLFSNVIGLALRGISKNPATGDVNLLPVTMKRFAIMPKREEKKAWKFIYIRLIILAIALAGLLAVLYITRQGTDIYRQIVPSPAYNSNMEANIDPGQLDALRNNLFVSTSTPTSTQEVILPQVSINQTSAGFLNVRSGPGVDFGIITTVDSGDTYNLVEEESGWYHIQIDEETDGWVSAIFATILEEAEESNGQAEGEVLGESFIEPEETSSAPGISQSRLVVLNTTLGYLNVRSGPSTIADKIGEVYPGQEFNILNEDNDWYQIELSSGEQGWVSSVYVDKL